MITASELLHGVQRADARRAVGRRAFVEHILAVMDPIPISTTVARVHAELWARSKPPAHRSEPTTSGSRRPPWLTTSAS